MIYLAWIIASLFVIFLLVPAIGSFILSNRATYKNCFVAGCFIIGVIIAAVSVFWSIFFLYKEYGGVL